LLAAATIALLIVAAPASAYVIGEFGWDGRGVQDWGRDHQTWPTLSAQASGAAAPGYLSIDFPGLGGGEPAAEEWYALLSMPASHLFVADWEQEMAVGFDFFAEGVAPDSLEVPTDAEGVGTWDDDPDGSGTNAGEWAGWNMSLASLERLITEPPVSEGDYLASLENVDWIGVYVFHDGMDDQNLTLDDEKLMIPEPHEYAMLAIALVVTTAALRRKVRTV